MTDPAAALSLAEQTKTVQAWDAEITELEVLVKDFDVEITDAEPELERDAVEFVRLARGLVKKVKGLRDEALEPLKGAIEQIKRIAGGRIQRAEGMADRVNARLSTLAQKRYDDEQEAQRVAAAKPALPAPDPNDIVAQTVAQARADVERIAGIAPQHVKGTAQLFDYGYDVTNEAEIPRPYLQPNDALLRAEAKRKPAPPEIPGVRFWKRPKTSVRG